MIGLVAAIIAGVTLNIWTQALAVVPYAIMKFGGRYSRYAVLGFYAYVVAVIIETGPVNLYSTAGASTAAILAGTSLLVLDDILRERFFDMKTLPLALVIVVSAVSTTVLAITMIAVGAFLARVEFGRKARYLYGWMVLIVMVLHFSRNVLQAPNAQALVIAGMALLLPLITEFGEKWLTVMRR